MLLSEVILVDKDFDSYRIADNSQELIFPMKELRAVLRLAEALGHPISIHFDSESGVCVCFSRTLLSLTGAARLSSLLSVSTSCT